MQFLTLNDNEVKELENLRKGTFNFYIILLCVSLLVTYSIMGILMGLETPSFLHFHLNPIHYFTKVAPHIVAFSVSNILLYKLFTRTKLYHKDIRLNKKKVYVGVLAQKSVSRNHKSETCYFYMDGNKFSVEKREYDKYDEGDIIEFHISPHSRHIFKVAKPPRFREGD